MATHSKRTPPQPDRPRLRSHGATPARAASAQSATPFAAAGDEALALGTPLVLDKSFRFDRGLAKRLRMREINETEAFTLRDATGVYFRASVKECDDRGGVAVAYERMNLSPESSVDIVLACAVLARQRMQFVMQKATELGVRRIVPLLTEHSVQADDLRAEQPHAWAGHIARAAKQCRRSSLPHLLEPQGLDVFLASPLLAATDLRFFLDDRSESLPPPGEGPKRIALFVGPEGGFSDDERQKLSAHARPWVLGGRVLRAETAALVGLTAVHATWGDFTRR